MMEEKTTAFVGGSGKKQKKFNGQCYRCGKTGHMKKYCRFKKVEADANIVVGGKAVTFGVNQANAAEKKHSAVFIIDSGCSDHPVNNRSFLQEVHKLKQPFAVVSMKAS